MTPARLPYSRLVAALSAALGILCFAGIAHGQDRWYRASLVTVGASQAADVASSWGGYELNPVLGTGRFGGRQAGIKLAIVGGGQAAQYAAVRAHPRWKRAATIINFALAGVTTGVAVRNWRIKR